MIKYKLSRLTTKQTKLSLIIQFRKNHKDKCQDLNSKTCTSCLKATLLNTWLTITIKAMYQTLPINQQLTIGLNQVISSMKIILVNIRVNISKYSLIEQVPRCFSILKTWTLLKKLNELISMNWGTRLKILVKVVTWTPYIMDAKSQIVRRYSHFEPNINLSTLRGMTT